MGWRAQECKCLGAGLAIASIRTLAGPPISTGAEDASVCSKNP